MEVFLLLLLLVLGLAYANGTNDVSKAIATLVGSGVTNYRTAIIWGTIWTTVGAAASGVLAGAIVGAGLMSIGSVGLAWPAITGKIGLPLLLSPVLALSLSLVLHPAIRF